jgi:hypothetical protein
MHILFNKITTITKKKGKKIKREMKINVAVV